MPETIVEAATPERWRDAVHALTGGGDGGSCWCQWWTLTNAEFQALSSDDRRELLRAEIEAGPPHQLIAYVSGIPSGWVRVGPRPAQARLRRTRLVLSGTSHPLDDPAVWAITCLVVRREHRGEGLAHELVRAAVGFARANGAAVIEAYPVDTAVRTSSNNELFHGTVSLFTAQGFTEVSRPQPARPVLQLVVQPASVG